MKKNRFFRIAAVMLLFGLVLAGCGDLDDGKSGQNEDNGETISDVTIDSLADGLDSLPKNTSSSLHTIVFASSLIIDNEDTDPNGAWASVNRATKDAGKYVILDLSACTAATISGVSSPSEISQEQNPNALNNIYDNAFIKGIILPDSLTTIGDSAFMSCEALTSITLPASVTTIDHNAFRDCTALTSITLPASVTTIGENAFRECAALTSITIPASVTSIEDGAFDNCTALTSITIPAGVTTIGDYAFKGCTALASVTIREGVTSIGDSAFRGCTALTSITLPASVTTIGDYAFESCAALTSVTFAEGSAIADEQFSNSAFPQGENLRMSYLSADPKAGTYTRPAGGNNWTKQDAGSLENVLAALESNTSSTPHTIVFASSFTINNEDTDPNGAWASVNKAIQDAEKYVILDLSACTAANNTISGIFSLDEDEISQHPNALNNISSNSFVKGIILPASLTTIGDYAFKSCAALTSITIPEGVTTIGQLAFRWCTALASVTIPEGVTTIENEAFYGCAALTSIIIPASVTSIGSGAFWDCEMLASVTIPEGVTTISNYAFYNCAALTSITIPEGVTSISNYAFGGCTALTSITVDSANSNYTSQDGVLFNKTQTTLIQYPAEKIGASYTIPEGVTTIGDHAFYNCTPLESITLPASVTSIGDYAFSDCEALTSVTFAEDSAIADEQFGNNAFPQDYYSWGGDNLRTSYLSGGAGTYTRLANGDIWTKQ
jgi:K+-transporting ATPase c subunit